MCPGPRIIPGMLFRVKYVRSVPAQYGAGDAEVPRAVVAADSAATASGCALCLGIRGHGLLGQKCLLLG